MKRVGRALATGAFVLLLGACTNATRTSDAPTEDDAKMPCSNLAEAYARCQSKMNVPERGGADRVSAMQASLTAHVAAAKTDDERRKVAHECESGLKQLRAVCP